MSFRPGQQPHYRDALRRAWLATCMRGNQDERDLRAFNDWKRKELIQAVGVPTSKACNHVQDYDRVMLHLAQISGDETAIAYFSKALERRMRFLIGRACVELAKLEGRDWNWEYVRSIYQHMNLPETEDGAPAEALYTVFQALDTQRRRILVARGALEPRSFNHRFGARRARKEEHHHAA